MKIDHWGHLKIKLQSLASQQHGIKTQLAHDIGETPQTINNWLNKDSEPRFSIGKAMELWLKTNAIEFPIDADPKYQENLLDTQHLANFAFRLSVDNTGLKTKSWHEIEGSILFAKICLHCRSILTLLPGSQYFHPTFNQTSWDFASIAALVRALIETYHVFYYLAVEQVSAIDREFRKLLWIFHSEHERFLMLKYINSKSENLHTVEKNSRNWKDQLSNCSYFNTLSNNEKQKWLSGKFACSVSPAEISENSGINKNYFRGVYKYLSNYAHATGFGIAQMDSMRTERGAYFQQYATMLQYVQCYLAFSISHFCSSPFVTVGKIDNHTIEQINFWGKFHANFLKL